MKSGLRLFGIVLLMLTSVWCFTTCELGLGAMVNTEKPKISTGDSDDSAPGAYLQSHVCDGSCPVGCELEGKNIIELVVEQQFGLKDVFMTVSYKKRVWDDTYGIYLVKSFTEEFPAWQDPDTGLWYVELPTQEWEDGRITTTVTAIDVSDNRVDTTDMIYYIKNAAPQIELSIPRIKGGNFDNPELNNNLQFEQIFTGDNIMGIASDAKGIAVGYPQIMIWPAMGNDYYNRPEDGGSVQWDANGFLAAEHPKWGHWQTVVDSDWKPVNQDPTDPMTAVQFRWPLVELLNGGGLPSADEQIYLVPGEYNIMIKLRDSFEAPHFNENQYPNRVENPDFSPEDNPVKFMTIKITSSTNPAFTIRNYPQYYNPDKEFRAELTIARGDNIVSRRAKFAESENQTQYDSMASNVSYANYVTTAGGGQGVFDIIIPSADVKSMGLNNLNGIKFLLILAIDGEGNTFTASTNIVFDNQAPYMNFIQPQGMRHETDPNNGPTVTSSVTLRGSALDNQIVHSMYYALGVSETSYVVSLGADALNDNFSGWIQTGLGDNDCLESCEPNCQNHLPINNHPGNGIPSVAVPTVRSTWIPDPNIVGILPAWTWQFADIFDFCVGAYDAVNSASPIGTKANYYVTLNNYDAQLWNLPIWFKIIDMAGNVVVIKSNLILDPNADLPKATINTPNDKSIVGGQVRVSGIAEDNEWVHSVEIRVSRRTEAGALDEPDQNSWYIGGPNTWVSLDHHDHGNIGAEGAMRSWFINLNSEPNEPLTPKNKGQLQSVLIEVRSRDAYLSTTNQIKPVPGRVESITLRFSPDVPRISDPLIIKGRWGDYLLTGGNQSDRDLLEEAYAYGDNKVAKNIVLKIPLETSADLDSIRVNIGGWEEYINRNESVAPYNNPWVERLTPAGQVSDNKYMLYVPIDTDTVNGDTFAWSSGTPNIFQIGIDCQDNSTNKFKANTVITLQVDNFYPLGVYDGYLTAKGNFDITGRAWDTAVGRTRVGAVERVVVFFSKDDGNNNGIGSPVYLNNGAIASTAQFPQSTFLVRRNRFGSAPTEQAQSVVEGNGGTNPEDLIFFPGGLMTNVVNIDGKNTVKWVSNNNGIVIDNDTQDIPSTNTGFKGGGTKTWSVNYNTKQLPDGKYILHYVIFDHAMNATHYFTHIYVANNRPEIKNVSLGTDNDSNGSVGNDELMIYPSAGSDALGYKENQPYFRVMNNRFRIDISAVSGNGTKRYRVYYATRDAANSITAGKVYTINNPGTLEWYNYGAPESHINAAGYAGVTFMATKAITQAELSSAGGASVLVYSDSQSNTLAEGLFVDAVAPEVLHTVTNDINFSANFPSDSNNVRIDPNTGRIEWDRDGSSARFYLIHVYDSAEGTYANTEAHRADQLSHVALINIGITNSDTMPPLLEVAPIGQQYVLRTSITEDPTLRNYRDRVAVDLPETAEGYNQNIVTNTAGARLGYVQYKKHAEDETRADISGMVIFKGKAMDNNSIRRITATIQGYHSDSPFEIATWRDNKLSAGSTAAGTTNNTMASMKNGFNQWGFDAEEVSSSGEYGNVLNWNFAWDSSRHSNLVENDVTITFTVYDAAGLASVVSTSPNVTSNFNIVPYISEIKTKLTDAFRSNPTAFSRSATGWYPVRETEVIKVLGFNLGRSSFTTTATIDGVDATAEFVSSGQIDVTVDTGIFSGELVLTTGPAGSTMTTLNNRNHETAHYNQEPNNLNNNELTDDRYLYVWRVGAFFNEGVGNRINGTTGTGNDFPYLNPVMRMDSNSNWYMNFGGSSTSNGKLWARKNGQTTTQVVSAQNRYRHTTAAFDSFGNHYTIAANQTAGTTDWQFFHKQSAAGGTWQATTIPGNTAGGDRFQLPRIATQTTGTTLSGTTPARVLVSYFDTLASPNNLYLHFGTVTGTGAGTATLNASQTVASNSTPHNGSMFTAIGFLSSGRPIITWYDRTNMNLVLSYGNAPGVITTSGFGYDTIYTAASHGLAAGTARANAVYAVNRDDSTSALRYVTRTPAAAADRFVLAATADTGAIGENMGSSVEIHKPIIIAEATSTLNAAGVVARGRSGMPGNYTGSPVHFILPSADHGLRLGDRVDLINGTTVVRDAYVVWLGLPGQANANNVVFRTTNDWAAAHTGTQVTGFATGVAAANLYVVLRSRAETTNLTVSAVNTASVTLTSTAGTNSATNVTTGSTSTTAATQAQINAALNTIVNHTNNTFGTTIAAAAMSATISAANIGTAMNAVVTNINTALGTSIAALTNPNSTGRTDVNTRLTTLTTNVNTAFTALGATANTSGIMYADAAGTTVNTALTLTTGARMFTLQANHGLTVGDWVDLTYNSVTTRLVVGWRGLSGDANNGNSVAFKTAVGNGANWFTTVPRGAAGNQVTITRINNPVPAPIISTALAQERYYTFPAANTPAAGSTFALSNGSYYVKEVLGNNVKFSVNASTPVLDLGAHNLEYSSTSSLTSVTETSTWQSNAKIVHSFAGSHVDMAIDGDDNIHLAYYDSLNGGLYYALVPPDGTIPDVDKAEYVKVDTYLSAGTRIMLNVRKETHDGVARYVPYISYFHASFDETRFSVRVAWRKDFTASLEKAAGSNDNDRLTGAWEVMTIPAENVPASGQYICHGVPTAATALVGTATAGFHTDISKTMIVTYPTDINYEGAMLRHKIWE